MSTIRRVLARESSAATRSANDPPSQRNVSPVSSPDEAYSQHGGSTARVSAPTGTVSPGADDGRSTRSTASAPFIAAASPPTAEAIPSHTATYSRRIRSAPRSAIAAIHSGLVPTSTRSPML